MKAIELALPGLARAGLRPVLALHALFYTLSPLYAYAATELEETIVTASRVQESLFMTPYSAEVITADGIRDQSFRTTPDIFRNIPGALVQKTAHGQGSPYIRGFTGFRNLFMIDGIRLNNAVFREGPNQYWATVDAGSIGQMEVVRGPKSVLYGSDAVGGTVNVLTRGPTGFRNNEDFQGRLFYRYGNAENSNIGGGAADIALSSQTGLYLSGSAKDFGDLESGGGELPNTGYDEWTLNTKLISDLSDKVTLTLAHFEVHQDDVPRTHRTIFSQAYAGTTPGSELRRDLDQDRTLSYARITALDWLGFQDWNLTTYHSLQEESRVRLRSGGRRDVQGLEVNTWGLNLSATRETDNLGVFTGGADWIRDNVDSLSSSNPVQGPVGDDSSYDWVGVFVQNRYHFNADLDLTTGLRLNYFAVDADSISDPVTGAPFSYNQSWTEPVASLRLGWTVLPHLRLYGGVSQGIRAPNLSDLTRFDSARSNEFEVPSVDLEPEQFISYELGAHFTRDGLGIDGAIFYTDINDQIQRLLTGRVNEDGEQQVTKANVGDGEIYGVEVKFSWLVAQHWRVFGHYAWLDGNISNEAQVGQASTEDVPDRMMPENYRLGVRYSPNAKKWWLETEWVHVSDADKLSLRDETDTQRIPPGGTPGYSLWHLRGGLNLTKRIDLNLSLENLLDEDYRVHGSGQNEPGRNLIASINYSF